MSQTLLLEVLKTHLVLPSTIDVLAPHSRLCVFVFSADDVCDDMTYRGFIVYAPDYSTALTLLSSYLITNHPVIEDILTYLGILETELTWTADLIGFTGTWNAEPGVYKIF